MENSLKQVFFSYGLSREEIEDMVSICSGLEIVDTERVIKNLSLLEQFGFPKYDLDSLIIINPTFMLSDPKELAKKLLNLGSNIEEKLKNDPFLI